MMDLWVSDRRQTTVQHDETTDATKVYPLKVQLQNWFNLGAIEITNV